MIAESEWLGRLLTSDVHEECMSQEEQTAPSSTSEMCKDEVIRESLRPVDPGSRSVCSESVTRPHIAIISQPPGPATNYTPSSA
jgi:hypothetical protein